MAAVCNQCYAQKALLGHHVCGSCYRKDTAEAVNHPPHYTQHPSGVECIQITEHMSFTLGNVVKYVWRADEKNGIEDLEKAVWYLKREIEKRKKEKNERARANPS